MAESDAIHHICKSISFVLLLFLQPRPQSLLSYGDNMTKGPGDEVAVFVV